MKTRRTLSTVLAAALSLLLVLPASAANADLRTTAAAGGMSHTLLLKSNGTVWACGSNEQLQIGQPAKVASSAALVQVKNISAVKAVAAGYNFSVALQDNGQVYLWGGGSNAEPRIVNGLSNIAAISAGQADCLALAIDGVVWHWVPGAAPARVPGLSGVVAISAGSSHFIALTRDGVVWTWGANWAGQLGNGTTADSAVPVKVDGLYNIIDVAAGYSHSLAVDFSGKVYAWGANSYGELGNGSKESSLHPICVPNLKNIAQVSAGNETSMAMSRDGLVYTWGYGEFGQLGTVKSNIFCLKPTQVTTGVQGRATSIASGVYHNLCVTSSGSIYAWGRNKNGQVGTQSNSNITQPVRLLSSGASMEPYNSCLMSGISAWASDEVSALYDRELVPPLLWNNYQGSITRAGLAHLLVSVYEQARNVTVTPSRSAKFADITGFLLEEDILKAYQLGFISGTSATTFSPNSFVTRQEAAKMLCSFVTKMKNTTIPDSAKNLSYYSDATQIAQWAAPYVSYAYENNIMRGADGKFSPSGSFTKEQSLLTIARLADKNDWKVK